MLSVEKVVPIESRYCLCAKESATQDETDLYPKFPMLSVKQNGSVAAYREKGSEKSVIIKTILLDNMMLSSKTEKSAHDLCGVISKMQ